MEALNKQFNTEIFNWLVPQYSAIYALAFIIVLLIFVNRAGKIGLSRSYAFWSGIWAIAFGLIGSRIYWLLQHIEEMVSTPTLILSGNTGSMGGYIGGILGFILSLRLYKVEILKYMDGAASALGIGIAIGRIGCFLGGCCFGKVSDLPWAVRFPKGTLPYNAHLVEGLIPINANASLSIHPVQIYDSLNGLLLFLLASWYWPKLRHWPGAIFFLFWLSFCVTRLGLEFLRDDKERGFIGHWSVPQFLCLILAFPLIGGLWWALKLRRCPKTKENI